MAIKQKAGIGITPWIAVAMLGCGGLANPAGTSAGSSTASGGTPPRGEFDPAPCISAMRGGGSTNVPGVPDSSSYSYEVAFAVRNNGGTAGNFTVELLGTPNGASFTYRPVLATYGPFAIAPGGILGPVLEGFGDGGGYDNFGILIRAQVGTSESKGDPVRIAADNGQCAARYR